MAVKHHGTVPFKGMSHLCLFGENQADRFGRLFQQLPPLYLSPPCSMKSANPAA